MRLVRLFIWAASWSSGGICITPSGTVLYRDLLLVLFQEMADSSRAELFAILEEPTVSGEPSLFVTLKTSLRAIDELPVLQAIFRQDSLTPDQLTQLFRSDTSAAMSGAFLATFLLLADSADKMLGMLKEVEASVDDILNVVRGSAIFDWRFVTVLAARPFISCLFEGLAAKRASVPVLISFLKTSQRGRHWGRDRGEVYYLDCVLFERQIADITNGIVFPTIDTMQLIQLIIWRLLLPNSYRSVPASY